MPDEPLVADGGEAVGRCWPLLLPDALAELMDEGIAAAVEE